MVPGDVLWVAKLRYEISYTPTSDEPPDEQESIFESFVQSRNAAHRRVGGTGLGLSICAQLVEAMGGAMTVSGNEDGHLHVDLQLS